MLKPLTSSTTMFVLFHLLPYHVIFISCVFTLTGQAFEMKTFNLGRQITKITFNEHSDFIFVGGHNFISVLTLELQEILKVDIGPVYEEEFCHPFRAPCDNNVTVLELDIMNNGLLVCGTAYQGTCVSHDALELSSYVCVNAPANRTTASRVSASTVGSTVVQVLDTVEKEYIADPNSAGGASPFGCRSFEYGLTSFDAFPASRPRPVRSNEVKRISLSADEGYRGGSISPTDLPRVVGVSFVTRILVASWEKPSKSDNEESQPIISLRSMSNSGMTFQMDFPDGQSASNTGIHVKPNMAHGFKMNFKHAFTSGNFTYLISLQTKPCDAKNVGNGDCTYTKLSRASNINPLLTPYTEMPLSCTHGGIQYDLLLSVADGKISSRANGSYVEVLVLIAAFGKEKIPGSEIPDPAHDTSVCVYSIDSINNNVFKPVMEMCLGGLPGRRTPDWIREDATERTCANRSYEVPESIARIGKAILHEGHVMAIMPHTPRLHDRQGTSLSSKMHVYTADQHGKIHKFTMESFRDHYGYDVQILDSLSLVFTLSPDALSSRVPTSPGVTDNVRAITYLTYGTEIASLSLDYCRQFRTCSMCQQNSQQCRWCSSMHSCLDTDDFQMRCSEEKPSDSCPPHLADFNPKNVPVSGGSVIKLRGMHLGWSGMGPVRVRVCNQECDYVKPRMNTLECTVRPKCEGCPDKCYIEVEIEQHNSYGNASSRTIPQNNQLNYVIPRVESISPDYGPVSGGIIITVKGEHLHAGTRSTLEVLGTKCREIYSTNEKDLTCLMDKGAQSVTGKCGPMIVNIDEHVTSDNSTQYCFREDPKIRQVEPNATLIDGGLFLNVTGSSLDSVSSVQFRVNVSVVEGNGTRPESFTSQCRIMDATSMTCETPSMDLLRDELSRKEYSPGYLSGRMGFLVDSRAEVKMYTSRTFYIYPMPKFYGFRADSKESYIHPKLEGKVFPIKAQFIQGWLKPSDVEVFVGETECPVRNITSDTIFCDVRQILSVYQADLTSTPTATTTSTSKVTTTTSSTPTRDSATKVPVPSSEMTTPRSYNVTTTTPISKLRVTNDTNGSAITTTATITIPVIGIGIPEENSSFSHSSGKEKSMALINDVSAEDDKIAISEKNLTKRGLSDSEKGVTERDAKNQGKPVRHQLRIRIGNYRSIIGSVQVGPVLDDLVNPPVRGDRNPGLDYFLIGGIVGAAVLCLVVLIAVCAVFMSKQKKRARRHPFYMNEIGSSHPGSSEQSMPTLTQILESELEPSKKSEINNLIISSDRLIMGNAIGSGNFGCVYEGMLAPKEKESPMKVAIKTLQDPVTHSINLREFVKEAIIMVGFQHPHVLGLVGLVETEMGVPYVVLPYMDNGDLLTYVRDPKRTLSLYDVIEFGIDLCSGMAYLSSVKLVHRDLAARNCMLDVEYRAKVADFGLCRDIYEKGYYTSDNKKKLPIRWMAVESIERGAYSTKSDVWSMGVVLWELLSRGVTPYPGVDGWDIINYLRKRRLSPPYFCPDELYKLMMTCWAKDPDMRPTFKALQKELCLLTGQDPGSGSTTPVISRSVKTTGETTTFKPGMRKRPSKIKDNSKKSNPKIQITPETPKEDLTQVEIELRRLEKVNQPDTSDTECGSVMSLPRSQAVENMMITIPACYSSRDVTKSAAANYLQLVDNYEPAPKFPNPFHKSKKKHSKSESRKSGSRKERSFSSRSRDGSEKRATPNDYSTPYDGQKIRTSGDMRDSQVRGHVDGLLAVHRPAGGNYFELERNSQRSSVNSILEGGSSGGSSFMTDPVRSVPGRFHAQNEPGTRCSSAAMSYQSMASSEDLTRPDSEANNYDRLSRDYIEKEGKDRHYHTWKEPEVELRVNENGEGYDRLCSEFMDPSTSPVYPRLQELDVTSRPDSCVAKYSRISDMEMEPDTSPYYQICEENGSPDDTQEEHVITSM